MADTKAATVAALVALAEAQGITPDDLAAALEGGPAAAPAPADVPTVREFLAVVEAGAPDKTRSAYGASWRWLVDGVPDRRVRGGAILADGLGDVPVPAVRASDLQILATAVRTGARRSHRNARDGISAEELFVSAVRRFFAAAVADGHRLDNPAQLVSKPPRPDPPRRPLTDAELADLYAATALGRDGSFDVMLVRFFVETGCRRAGALGVTLADLDLDRQMVRLNEKNLNIRWQPISADLTAALVRSARERGAVAPTDAVFRYRNGRPLTTRRPDGIVERWRRQVPWAAQLGVSFHWLRHTAVARVERVGAEAVAGRFAGHRPASRGVTATYTTATEAEVVAAWCVAYGQTHPLAPAKPDA